MRMVDTDEATGTLATMETSIFSWLQRRALTLFALLAVAGICVAVLSGIPTQARPPQAAVPLYAVQAAARDRASVGLGAPTVSVSEVQAYERNMQRLLELNTMDDPMAHTLLPWRDASQREGPF